MPVYKGATAIGAIYKGATAIAKVYKGSTLVFQPDTGGNRQFMTPGGLLIANGSRQFMLNETLVSEA